MAEGGAGATAQGEERKIPVTIITGFLGSGKTTLLNWILSSKEHGKRIAIIENEFGEVSIDDAIVVERTSEEIVTLDNGCVCCTVRGDLVKSLHGLLERRDNFDYIIVETTGLADPTPVAITFQFDEKVRSMTQMDSVVTVVDAAHVLRHLKDKAVEEGKVNISVQQVAFADKILLNKTDLVDPAKLKEVKEEIRLINGVAKIIETQYSKADLDEVLDVRGFDIGKLNDFEVEEKDDHHHHHDHKHHHHDHECGEDCDHDHHDHKHHDHDHKHHDHDHKHHDHDHECGEDCDHDHHKHDHEHKKKKSRHDSGVSSVGLEVEGVLDIIQLNQWLGSFLMTRGDDIYRSKGILAIEGTDDKFVFQGVHMMTTMATSANTPGIQPWGENEKRINKMVFIGKNLDREDITKNFMACLVKQ
ncbi:cobalamin biosynthesis protein [Chloropicon primus]|nr:cobalamin biosynthesis protein [Chloropicon primus]